jgi:hypothetical protein
MHLLICNLKKLSLFFLKKKNTLSNGIIFTILFKNMFGLQHYMAKGTLSALKWKMKNIKIAFYALIRYLKVCYVSNFIKEILQFEPYEINYSI